MSAALFAAAAAMFIGLACAAQQRGTHGVAHHSPLHPGLLVALIRRPWWMLGGLASVAGLGLQVAALAAGSIIVVQCVMATSLGWTMLGEWVLARHRPTRQAAAGIGLAALGLLGLLVLLAPSTVATSLSHTVPATATVVLGCAAAAAAGLAWSRWGRPSTRALGLAIATGCAYGLTAALLKLVSNQLQAGWSEPLHHPALYAACVLGPAAVLLSQNTFQQGRRATPAVAIILLADPVIGLAAGTTWFGEHIITTPLVLAGAAFSAVTALIGVLILQSDTHRGADTDRRPGAPATQRAGTAMTANVNSYLTTVHPLSTLYRRAAMIYGTGLIVFGVLGLLEPPFLTITTSTVTADGWSSLLSLLSIAAGVALVVAGLRNGAVASTAMASIGTLFLISGLVHLTVLIAALGATAFRFPNGVFSVLIGTLLLLTGSYGRFTGNLPHDNPWRIARTISALGYRQLV